MAVASWFFIVGGIDIPAKENPPLHAGEFSRTGHHSRLRIDPPPIQSAANCAVVKNRAETRSFETRFAALSMPLARS